MNFLFYLKCFITSLELQRIRNSSVLPRCTITLTSKIMHRDVLLLWLIGVEMSQMYSPTSWSDFNVFQGLLWPLKIIFFDILIITFVIILKFFMKGGILINYSFTLLSTQSQSFWIINYKYFLIFYILNVKNHTKLEMCKDIAVCHCNIFLKQKLSIFNKAGR